MKRTALYYWLIVVLLMFATALSFMDRQVLSISILKIRISDQLYLDVHVRRHLRRSLWK